NSTYRTYFENKLSSSPYNGDPLKFPGANHYSYINSTGSMYGICGAYMDYVDTTRTVNETLRTQLKNLFISKASALNTNNNKTAYNVPMLYYNDLSWGSSGLLCENAYILMRAYQWTGTTNYRNAAIDVLDWIGGRNPVSRVFITGFGDHLHGTDNYSFYLFDYLDPVPGYLSGNINAFGSDWGQHTLNYHIKNRYKYYLNIQTAGVLEPCLPWQAEMCWLLGQFAYNLNLTGDVNLDGTINYSDVMTFSNAWLTKPEDSGWNANCDIAQPKDEIINFLDFAVFANQWLQ
ncbi:MAG TPA: glycoside hydrolase family 9 protein, partial [Ignavibacteriales bacterium]|nr:glycoside hydrolase family 9 protein [Ignavibacteriales bacterium]